MTKNSGKGKNKSAKLEVRPFMVKNYLWVFVNSTITNPTFDSQVPLYSGNTVLRGRTCIDSHNLKHDIVYLRFITVHARSATLPVWATLYSVTCNHSICSLHPVLYVVVAWQENQMAQQLSQILLACRLKKP